MMMLATIRGVVFEVGTVILTIALYLPLAPLRAQGTESSSGQNIHQTNRLITVKAAKSLALSVCRIA
jgi:hypothetical protein